MLNAATFFNLLAERWNQAVADPTFSNLLNVAQFADAVANAIEQHERNHVLIPSARGIAAAARVRIAAMTPTMPLDDYDETERTHHLDFIGGF